MLHTSGTNRSVALSNNRCRGFRPKLLGSILVCGMVVFLDGRAFAQERSGFTILADLGVGIQNDTSIEETEVGLAGLNVGVGGFLTSELALMFRLVSTGVSYEIGGLDYRQVSGVGGAALQYWVAERVNVEAGGGFGFWNGADQDERGFGLILGTGVTLWNRGKHNFQFGLQYAPAFTDPGTVHNVGFTVGYQFF